MKVLEKIKEAKEKKLASLNLSHDEMAYLPISIIELDHLEELIIGFFNDFTGRGFVSTGKCKLKELPAGFENLQNLKTLVLSSSFFGKPTEIKDFSSIWKLKNLETLVLHGSNIRSIEKIGNLKNLKFLSLDNTMLDDYSPISNLRKLETLQLGDIGLNSIEFLREMNSLRNISITTNNLDSIDSIKDNPNLEKICTCNNPLQFESFPLKSKKLKFVCMTNSGLSNPEFIRDLPLLEEVCGFRLSFNDISNNKNIQEVCLHDVTNSQMEQLGKFNKIRKLEIHGDITHLGTINKLKNLEILDLYTPKLKSLSGLEELTNLQMFYSQGKYNSIKELHTHRKLRSFRTYDIPITSIDPLRQITNLESVNFSGSMVKSLDPIIRQFRKKDFVIKLEDNVNLREEEKILNDKGKDGLYTYLTRIK